MAREIRLTDTQKSRYEHRGLAIIDLSQIATNLVEASIILEELVAIAPPIEFWANTTHRSKDQLPKVMICSDKYPKENIPNDLAKKAGGRFDPGKTPVTLDIAVRWKDPAGYDFSQTPSYENS